MLLLILASASPRNCVNEPKPGALIGIEHLPSLPAHSPDRRLSMITDLQSYVVSDTGSTSHLYRPVKQLKSSCLPWNSDG